ncbi:hypothetical protein KDK95_01960 [Actinospica sp. MGRD01-02]|uniref:Spore-associated protein A n=1 Tax=Actinospica acidithermotolerans TaxID=2828514 RepID=A0A941E9K2_9ACTN|nr:hypothetical protein [Actinospica acidithermotolerans]MBR7825054.1 hypothetical protein [Actinospica acidithermotolerans]
MRIPLPSAAFRRTAPFRRTAALAATGAIVGAGLFFAGSAPAQASSLCSGVEVDHASLVDVEGTDVARGTLYLYYDSSTGKNCAYATNNTGVRHEMDVYITRCAAGTGQTVSTCQDSDPLVTGTANDDYGNYISYAGPVNTLGSAAGVCIKAFGGIDTGTEYASAFIGGHCG